MAENVTVPDVAARKRRNGSQPLVMVTAYDAPGARIADAGGVDVILVGDSVAMTVLGHDDTLQVTISDMAYHVAAVARADPRPLVVADMPWLSYHLGAADAVRNASALVRAGAQAVKLEGGLRRLETVEAILAAEIPVMGHLGLTPQSLNATGGFKVQARDVESARTLVEEAVALCAAGCFAIVLEGVPDVVAGMVTDEVDVPTIGIGAGRWCDGQVLVFHDLLGLQDGAHPKFVRRYAELGREAVSALAAFAADVRQGRFPADSESYHARDEVSAALLGARRTEPGGTGPVRASHREAGV